MKKLTKREMDELNDEIVHQIQRKLDRRFSFAVERDGSSAIQTIVYDTRKFEYVADYSILRDQNRVTIRTSDWKLRKAVEDTVHLFMLRRQEPTRRRR